MGICCEWGRVVNEDALVDDALRRRIWAWHVEQHLRFYDGVADDALAIRDRLPV